MKLTEKPDLRQAASKPGFLSIVWTVKDPNILADYFFCQGAGVVSGQPFSMGSLLSLDHPIQELS